MKKNSWFGGIALLAASPVLFAQSITELHQRLAEKEVENQRLRERIEVLERELTPRRVVQKSAPPADSHADQEDSNRALERALVRERGLLLSPKTFEVEPNFVYSYIDNSTGFRRASFGPGLVIRAGLPWQSQFEVGIPYVYEHRRSGGNSSNSSGIGDLAFSLSHQFLRERGSMPSLIGTLNYQASTGKNTLFTNAEPVARGSGFDSIQGSLVAIKRIDPLVFFGSYGFTHNFSETKNSVRVEPGNVHSLRFGTALATGPDTSLRAALNLSYFDKTRVGGVALTGTNDPSGLFEFGGSVVLTESTAIDVLVGIGLTRNSPDYRISVALPIRY
jgi:hypothetical protein